MADDDKVVVTAKDIYGEVIKLVVEMRQLTQELKESRKTDDDHEQRIRSLEAWKYGLPAALLMAIAGVVLNFIGKA
jgi:hypothetical protein